jgi:hypothetical protein
MIGWGFWGVEEWVLMWVVVCAITRAEHVLE